MRPRSLPIRCDTKIVEQEHQSTAPEPQKLHQSREELAQYQLEMIQIEAHEIWLKRKVNGTPGDPAHDWEEAERHYYSNN